MGISSALGSSALVPAGFGFRNLVINGDFRINQRAFSSATADASFGFDRWQLATSGGTTYSAQTFTVGNAISGQEPINFARLVTTGQSGTGVYSILSHRIEDVRNCAGQTTTVSFWAKANSGTPKVAIEFEQNFGSGGSPSSTVQTYFGQVTLSTTWTRYVVTGLVPSISGKTIGTTANASNLRLMLWVSAGTNYNSRTGSIGIQTNTFDFWGVQVEANNVPTSFEQRPIGVELALCQRYYERTWNKMHIGMGVSENGVVATFVNIPIVPKRSSTLTITSSGTLYQHWGGTQGTYAGYDYSAPDCYLWVKYTSAPLSAGAVGMMYLNSGYLEVSAEL